MYLQANLKQENKISKIAQPSKQQATAIYHILAIQIAHLIRLLNNLRLADQTLK